MVIPNPGIVREDVARALREDEATGDLTAGLVPEQSARATILCRQQAVLCGIPWAAEVFHQLEPSIALEWQAEDGDRVEADTVVCELRGSGRALLQGERTALNFLQLLSATASRTRQFAQALDSAPCMLLDTRKTLPGLRHAQKYAVHCGGGVAHRSSLAEAILIKENHWTLLPDLEAAIREARSQHPDTQVIVEVENLEQLERVRAARPDVILLDNFSPEQARSAATECPDIPLEISGGVTESNLADYAAAGAARISLGTLTKDIQAIDFSMRLEQA